MKKISITLLIIILSIVGYFSYINIFEKKSDLRNDVSVDTDSLKKEIVNNEFKDWQNNSECLGESHKYYDIGFGFENVYKGSVTSEKEVKITLSCDHKSLKIEGSVNQVIKAKDLSQYFNGEEMELADTISGSLVIEVEKDYDFDGYNDLTSIWSQGSDISSKLIFLYDDKDNIFVFNKELSSIDNLNVSPEGDLYTSHCYYNQEKDDVYCSKDFYVLNSDGKLKKNTYKTK